MEFMSVKMRTTKLYLHIYHNITNQIQSKHLYTMNSYKVHLFLILMFLLNDFNFGGKNFIVAFQVCKCPDEENEPQETYVCMYFVCVDVHICQTSTVHLPPHHLFKHPHPFAILAYFLQVPTPTPASPCGRHKSMIPYC